MRRWLARLSFSFLIIGGVLMWDVWRAMNGRGSPMGPWEMRLHFAGALLCIILGFTGIRLRHQRQDDPDPPH